MRVIKLEKSIEKLEEIALNSSTNSPQPITTTCHHGPIYSLSSSSSCSSRKAFSTSDLF